MSCKERVCQVCRGFVTLAFTLIGMSGYRVDNLFNRDYRQQHGVAMSLCHGAVFLALVVWMNFFAPFHGKLWAIGTLYGGAWAFYYIGNTVATASRARKWWCDRFGIERAYAQYEVLVGVMFVFQGWAISSACKTHWNDYFHRSHDILEHVNPYIINGAALLLFGVGMVIKVWATIVTGLDTYYYKDMFQQKPSTKGWVVSGPYHVFSNPMYGVGNLNAYGVAVFFRSTPGLIASAFFQISIYLFYYFAEKPSCDKLYASSTMDSASSSVPREMQPDGSHPDIDQTTTLGVVVCTEPCGQEVVESDDVRLLNQYL